MRITGAWRARKAAPASRASAIDQDEFRQRQDFPDDAVAAHHESRAERDEISGHMRGEQSGQAEKAGGVDKAAVERQQGRDRRRSAREFHGCIVAGWISSCP